MSEPGPFSFLRRRTFLRLGIGGGAVVGSSLVGLRALRGSAPAVEGLQILDAHEHRTFRNIARAQLPSGGAFGAGAGALPRIVVEPHAGAHHLVRPLPDRPLPRRDTGLTDSTGSKRARYTRWMRVSSILLSTILCTSATTMVGSFLSSPMGDALLEGRHECGRGHDSADFGADGEHELDERPSLEGKVLVAAHDLDDPYFGGSIIYILGDDEGGTLGVLLNRPRHTAAPGVMIWEGGPVGRHRVFVLHDDLEHDGSVLIGDVAVAADPQILNDVLEGGGPAHARVFIGYAGWGPGQLERELAQGAWLVADPAPGMLLH